MGIKKRTLVDQARIEAFGAAADAPITAPMSEPALAAPPPRAVPAQWKPRQVASPARTPKAGEWPADLARSILIRYNAPSLALELAEVATLEQRSQHKTALRALERGLEALRAENRG